MAIKGRCKQIMVADRKLARSGLGVIFGGKAQPPRPKRSGAHECNCGKRRLSFGKQIEPVGQRASHQERKGVMKREES